VVSMANGTALAACSVARAKRLVCSFTSHTT
jgi:hypothetical protein